MKEDIIDCTLPLGCKDNPGFLGNGIAQLERSVLQRKMLDRIFVPNRQYKKILNASSQAYKKGDAYHYPIYPEFKLDGEIGKFENIRIITSQEEADRLTKGKWTTEDGKMKKEITIGEMDRGYYLKCGCAAMCFGRSAKEKKHLIYWISSYIKDPVATERKFNEKYRNKTDVG